LAAIPDLQINYLDSTCHPWVTYSSAKIKAAKSEQMLLLGQLA
jgi:hypothetical protein